MNLIDQLASNFFTRAQADILLRLLATLVADGRYVAVAGDISNLDGVVVGNGIYERVGDSVRYGFVATVDPTAAGAAEFTLTLPIDPGADFTDEPDVVGGGDGILVDAGVGTRTARIRFTAANGTAFDISGSLVYRVRP